jgi:hypothetical protein
MVTVSRDRLFSVRWIAYGSYTPRETLQRMTFRRPQSDRLLLFLSRLVPVEAGCHWAGLKLGLSDQDA